MAKPTRIRSLRHRHAEAAVDLRRRRAWFDDEQQQPTQSTSETPKPDTAPGQQSGQQATFTQEQLNQIVGDRVKRAEESRIKKLLDELGVDSADTLTRLVQAERQRAEGEKSELQKLQERLAAAEKNAADAQNLLAEAEKKRLIERRDEEIKSALRDARTNKPGSVLTLMAAEHPEMVEAVMKNGAVDKDALSKLVELAKKEHAEMFVGGGPGSPSNRGGDIPEPAKAKKERARQEQAMRLKRRF